MYHLRHYHAALSGRSILPGPPEDLNAAFRRLADRMLVAEPVEARWLPFDRLTQSVHPGRERNCAPNVGQTLVCHANCKFALPGNRELTCREMARRVRPFGGLAECPVDRERSCLVVEPVEAASYGCTTRPRNNTAPVWLSRMRKRNGRSTLTTMGSPTGIDFKPITTPVAAAASVPSSLTFT